MKGAVSDDALSFLKNVASGVASDKNVKATVVSQAITSVTGIAPIIDKSDPKVTWVKLVPKHGDYAEALFLRATKAQAGKPVDFKIDVMPALKPFILNRFLPVILFGVTGLVGVGYYLGQRKKVSRR